MAKEEHSWGQEFTLDPFSKFTLKNLYITLLYTGNPKKGNLANGEDPDEMKHNAVFHQDLHCLLRLKQSSGTEIHHNSESSTCDPLEYKMGNPLLFVSICMGKSIRIQRVNKM